MKKIPIRKIVESLLKKIETLENQIFGQKLLIDELESKLQRTEESLKKIQEDPYGAWSIPYIQPSSPIQTPSPMQVHVCVPGSPDATGTPHCVYCGALVSSFIITTTCSSSGISVVIPDNSNKED